jgi:hypothetical protein
MLHPRLSIALRGQEVFDVSEGGLYTALVAWLPFGHSETLRKEKCEIFYLYPTSEGHRSKP